MIRILFLAANPDNADTLLAGDELHQIEAALKHTRFEVIAKPAAHLGDLRDLLRQYKPQIVNANLSLHLTPLASQQFAKWG